MGRQPTFGIRFALVITIASITTLLLAGCSTVNEGGGGTAAAPTTSTQTLEYYPYQVKGYQNSYPKKTIEILMPADARDTTGAAPLRIRVDGPRERRVGARAGRRARAG